MGWCFGSTPIKRQEPCAQINALLTQVNSMGSRAVARLTTPSKIFKRSEKTDAVRAGGVCVCVGWGRVEVRWRRDKHMLIAHKPVFEGSDGDLTESVFAGESVSD